MSEPLRSILAPTHGTLLFQEQTLRIAVHYAGFDWPEADRFRSRLSKAEDDQDLQPLREAFIAGAALTCGAFPDEAEAVFGLCVTKQKPPTAGGFAFYVLEDGASRAQAVISPDLWEAHRVLLRDARALIVHGEATVRVERLSELPVGGWASAAD